MRKTGTKVLLINKSKNEHKLFTDFIESKKLNYGVTISQTISKKDLESQEFSVILLYYSQNSDLKIFNIIKHTPVLFIFSEGSEQGAIKALKSGAYDCILKDQEHNYLKTLPGIIKKAIEYQKSLNLNKILSDTVAKALSQSETKYKSLIENAPIGILTADINGNIVDVNNILVNILGSPSKEETKEINLLAFSPLKESGFSSDFLKCLETRAIITSEIPYKTKWGKSIFIRYQLTCILAPQGNVTGIQALVEDITQRKKSEKALKESEELYRTLARNLPNSAVLLFDENLRFKIAEGASLNLADLSRFEGKTIWEVLPPESISSLEPFYRASLGGKKISFEKQFGEQIYLIHMLPVKNDKDEIFAGMVVYQDITEQKIAEEQIKSSLKEKEILLKEIHHRVKNNLQVVSSLLSLQSNYIRDKNALDIFKESQNRVRTMALIHEKLYQTENLSSIDFDQYVTSLASHLYQSYNINTNSIDFKIQTNNIFLDVETAIPIGLIINELISNSLKYAFSSQEDCIIFIYLYYNKNNELELVIGDNGIGLPAELDFRNTETLGLQLIVNLVEQLDGEIELERNNGISFRIRFPGLIL